MANEELERQVEERTKELVESENHLREYSKRLERSNADLQQFAYIASHDIQEPVRMVISFLSRLEQRCGDQLDDRARQYMHFAIDGGMRARALIQDLLEFSRVDTQGKPFQETDMETVLHNILENLSVKIKEENASITHDPLPTVLADECQMSQVFQNLISNAIKFHGDREPVIHVSCEDKGQEWLFSVRDNGIGIDPEHRDKIFMLFERLHNREEYEGTGIGLSIAKKVVERHGGEIWFDSQVNIGTIFYFKMPKGPGMGS
jgi:light-regulated signal transduction histidine kinase (bacteriophytochrome)